MGAVKVRNLNPQRKYRCGNDYYFEFKSLLMNSVKIIDTRTGEELDEPTENFIKSTLIENNQIGRDNLTDVWACAYGEGLNNYYNPEFVTFVFPNRSSYQRKISYEPDETGAFLIKGLPTAIPLSMIIQHTADILNECDISIRQNLIATRTPFIAVVPSEELQLSVQQAVQQKEEGKPVVVVSPELGEAVKGVEFATPYLVDKIADYRGLERDILLNKLGIMCANTDKRERVQSAEVNATIGQCIDYHHLWIDNFNKQMKTYNLPYEMQNNGLTEDIYSIDEPLEDMNTEQESNENDN